MKPFHNEFENETIYPVIAVSTWTITIELEAGFPAKNG